MAITFHNEDIAMPSIKKRITSKWIKEVISSFGNRTGDIAYIFCSDEKILEINKEYLKHDYYTDIITFDYTEGDIVSGDIFISLDTVKSNSEKFNTVFEDELNRIIIHGVLHLCGINDKSSEEREDMTERENWALDMFKRLI